LLLKSDVFWRALCIDSIFRAPSANKDR